MTGMQAFQAKFHWLLVKPGPDYVYARKQKTLTVQTHFPEIFNGTAVELLC